MNNWTPITTAMPEANTRVLVTHNTFGEKEVCIAIMWVYSKTNQPIWHQDSEHVNVGRADACINHDELNVTHWMPIIDPA